MTGGGYSDITTAGPSSDYSNFMTSPPTCRPLPRTAQIGACLPAEKLTTIPPLPPPPPPPHQAPPPPPPPQPSSFYPHTLILDCLGWGWKASAEKLTITHPSALPPPPPATCLLPPPSAPPPPPPSPLHFTPTLPPPPLMHRSMLRAK